VEYLAKLKEILRERIDHTARQRFNYHVPSLWLNPETRIRRTYSVNPLRFFLEAIRKIEQIPAATFEHGSGGEWSRKAVVYSMYVRSTCAFDHDRNGQIDVECNADGLREVGTFLKAIGLLPYIRHLGVNTLHLLPVTAIGHDGRKGSLGAPYAIRNPFKLDEMLAEPIVGAGVDVEFGAFVEAAHRLGIRVVSEFAFRTTARDSDWIAEHPEWFYWIKADIPDRPASSSDESKFGAPIFTDEELRTIESVVNEGRFDNLPAPRESYRKMFAPPPQHDKISLVGGKYFGLLDDGTSVRIPGAFADWPPNDIQPPWTDVTYLRLYDHPDFNYTAYNTVRMYDSRLARPENAQRELWDRIAAIIPHFQKTFGLDGVMIDMGHALPAELKHQIVGAARSIDPDFAFWDENFSVTTKSREEGYNAVVGYCWIDQHPLEKFRNLLRRCEGEGFPLPFLATPETHNTPRAATRSGGTAYSKIAWFIDCFLPAIPYLHSGFELGERIPVNTGLDFSGEDIAQYSPEMLPLFSQAAYIWINKEALTSWVSKVIKLRERFAPIITNPDPSSFKILDVGNDKVVGFARKSADAPTTINVAASYDFDREQQISIPLQTKRTQVTDLITGETLPLRDGRLEVTLPAAGCLLFEH
jgi:hypothetical protein